MVQSGLPHEHQKAGYVASSSGGRRERRTKVA